MLQSTDKNGITFKESLDKSNFRGLEENRLQDATAFLELHIEQGPVLESESLSIGVVECVVGMVCYEIEVIGDSDHAGTTPMSMRKDALFTTNNLITEIRDNLSHLSSELVYTVGRMNVHPNIHSVIPNKVVFTLEARHKNADVIRQVEDFMENLIHSNGKEKCQVNVSKLWERDTVWFEKKLVDSLERSTQFFGHPFKRMVSGAGHDAQFIGTYIPSAMLFVPSVNGKSHAEDEFTSIDDCEKGVNVLLQTVLELAIKGKINRA